MDEGKELVPVEGEVVSADTADELLAALNKMAEVLQNAVVCMLSQNTRDVDIAARTADAIYDQGKQHASPDEQLLLDLMRHVVALYVPLTRVVAFQTEGRFSHALDEIAKALVTSNSAIAISQEYARLPKADKDVSEIYRSILSVFPILFRGIDAYVRADIVGYQGNIRQYEELLRVAIQEYRQADKLPSSLDPQFLALVSMCTTMADRLETRAEVFASKEDQRYLSPIGDRIFIVHGHDEAKWRELRDLLEDQLNLKTTVLKEEPGAGETLIQKFEKFADDCCYAFVLLTPDDFISKGDKTYFQARPNVLFELGWFYGHFGRDRVCIVKKAKTEIHSDLAGILSIDFHDEVSEGLAKIQAELQRVGIIAGGNQRLTRRSTGRAKRTARQ